jgi:hypothetical protein
MRSPAGWPWQLLKGQDCYFSFWLPNFKFGVTCEPREEFEDMQDSESWFVLPVQHQCTSYAGIKRPSRITNIFFFINSRFP